MKPWEKELPVSYPDVGRFDASLFDPEKWWTTYANPAFEKMTARDAFWGAKIVTAFTDEDLRTIVGRAAYGEASGTYVVQTLAARRDKIGRTWLDVRRINPLDNFRLSPDGDLTFQDLAVDRGYADAAQTVYRRRVDKGSWTESAQPSLRIPQTAKQVTLKTCRAGRCSPALQLTLYPSQGSFGILTIER